MNHQKPILEISELSKSFGNKLVLNNLNLSINKGEVLALIGASGSGKSTLLSILTGLYKADSGTILYCGKPISKKNSPFAFMPQRDALLPWRKVVQNASLGLEVLGESKQTAEKKVSELIESFGLKGSENLYPRQLSGGMRQRVAFLRTVVQHKAVLLLDEPFGALDAITRNELQNWILNMWQKYNWTILLITHDIQEALKLADRALVLDANTGSIAGQVAVPRDIDRGNNFLSDARIPILEKKLRNLL